MAEMIVVEDRNQDDLSRKAGCYLYVDTELWLEDDQVHRSDGPAIIAPVAPSGGTSMERNSRAMSTPSFSKTNGRCNAASTRRGRSPFSRPIF
jgi:hypothetical protein